ncbi:MAG: hypothetical protein KBC96_09555 [Armatimonadetes bacterium]|nr:hypothetical protein [Armatimonadota bacterium]
MRRCGRAALPNDKTQIAATDRETDRLVYELYRLTDEEIKIVEGTGSHRDPLPLVDRIAEDIESRFLHDL